MDVIRKGKVGKLIISYKKTFVGHAVFIYVCISTMCSVYEYCLSNQFAIILGTLHVTKSDKK